MTPRATASATGPDFVEQMGVDRCRLQEVEATRLDQGQRTQALRKAQCKSERDTAAIGVTDEMDRSGVAGILNRGRFLGKAQGASAIPARGGAVAVELDRFGAKTGQLIGEGLPLPRRTGRAVDQHDPL